MWMAPWVAHRRRASSNVISRSSKPARPPGRRTPLLGLVVSLALLPSQALAFGGSLPHPPGPASSEDAPGTEEPAPSEGETEAPPAPAAEPESAPEAPPPGGDQAPESPPQPTPSTETEAGPIGLAPTTPRAQAEKKKIPDATDSLPGSPTSPGVGLSPESPPVGPAGGGRAPSYGAPTDPDAWAFRLGGKIEAIESVGFPGKRQHPADGQSSYPLRVPSRTTGKTPNGGSSFMSLNLNYGNSLVTATINYNIRAHGKEYYGWYRISDGQPNVNQAYVSITPQPLGALRLSAKFGAISDFYGGVGQWQWGIFGPLLATRGYGETVVAEYDASPDIRLWFAQGFAVVPGMPEFYVRGNQEYWNDPGVTSFVNHLHAGFNYQGRFSSRIHLARVNGVDERKYLAPQFYQEYRDCRDNNLVDGSDPTDDALSPLGSNDPAYRGPALHAQDTPEGIVWVLDPTCPPRPYDGHIDILSLENHLFLNQYGHAGLAAAVYDYKHAVAVHDAMWWGIDWTQGHREMELKFIGERSHATGRVLAISAQYDLSVASVLWYPRPFDGHAPDLRIGVAGLYHRTLKTDDDRFDGASGYYAGLELDYRMLPWLSATFRTYAENRTGIPCYLDQNGICRTLDAETAGRYHVYSINPGLAFRSDWQASERLELTYSRRFYNDISDPNPADRFDRHAIILGASLEF